jgi:hypothetical protein
MAQTRVNVLGRRTPAKLNVPERRAPDDDRRPGTTDSIGERSDPALNEPPNVRERPGGDVPRSMTALLTMFLITLNGVGIFGQSLWFHGEITSGTGTFGNDQWLWAPSVTASLIVEMFGVYLSFMAHAKVMHDQAAFRTRAASYLIGAGVGWLTFDHFDRSGMTSIGIVLGGASALSPWMWAIYSEYRYRAERMARGLTDQRAVKLSSARLLWHPLRSLGVLSWASWAGVIRPDAAVAGWEASRRSRRRENVRRPLRVPDVVRRSSFGPGSVPGRRRVVVRRPVHDHPASFGLDAPVRRDVLPPATSPAGNVHPEPLAVTGPVANHDVVPARSRSLVNVHGTFWSGSERSGDGSVAMHPLARRLPDDVRSDLVVMVAASRIPSDRRREMIARIRQAIPGVTVEEIAGLMDVTTRCVWKVTSRP